MLLAIGNTARLMSRSMYSQILEQVSLFYPFTLHDSVRSELVFWLSNLDQRNGGFGREDLHFRVLAVRRINFRSARFFNAGFCTADLVQNVALFVFGK